MGISSGSEGRLGRGDRLSRSVFCVDVIMVNNLEESRNDAW